MAMRNTGNFIACLLLLVLGLATTSGAAGINSFESIASAPPIEKKKPVITQPDRVGKKEFPSGGAVALHFLLIGRHSGETIPAIVMVVTLVPQSYSRLLDLDPTLLFPPAGDITGTGMLSGTLTGRRENCRRLTDRAGRLTGQNISFLVELDLKGFVAMVDLMGGSPEYPEADRERGDILGGEIVLQRLLEDSGSGCNTKQGLITALLETARDLDGTSLGWKLLWTGYRNLQTNMALSDLLRVREITQTIRPDQVFFQEFPTRKKGGASGKNFQTHPTNNDEEQPATC